MISLKRHEKGAMTFLGLRLTLPGQIGNVNTIVSEQDRVTNSEFDYGRYPVAITKSVASSDGEGGLLL